MKPGDGKKDVEKHANPSYRLGLSVLEWYEERKRVPSLPGFLSHPFSSPSSPLFSALSSLHALRTVELLDIIHPPLSGSNRYHGAAPEPECVYPGNSTTSTAQLRSEEAVHWNGTVEVVQMNLEGSPTHTTSYKRS